MDAGTPAETLLAESTGRLRDHRTETALLLALEVVALSPAAVGDRELLRRLAACQERVQERLRARDQHAGEEHRTTTESSAGTGRELHQFERTYLERLRLAAQVILDSALDLEFVTDPLEAELSIFKERTELLLLLPG